MDRLCTDFTDECLEPDSGCPRGDRLRKVLSEEVIKLIQDNWWEKDSNGMD